MRELIYYVATTLDGFIAGPDGSFDFFPMDADYAREMNEDWSDGLPTGLHDALGITPPRSKWDTVVMGRGTFEPAMQAGIADPYAHLDTYVYSSTLDPRDHPGIAIVGGDPVAHVRRLKESEGGDVWLCGGGALADALADDIDRLVLKINPVTVGDGTRLFAGGFEPRSWQLQRTRSFDIGVVLAEYDRVRRPA